MSKNKTLLEVCLSPDLGGLELYMHSCANELKNGFHTLSVIAKSSKLENFFFSSQLQYFSLKRKSSFSFSNIWNLAKIIDENNVDIVHIHWTKDIPVVVLAKLFSKRKPKIVQTRHMMMTRFKNDFYHTFLYKNIDLIICVTQQVQEQIKKFIPAIICPKTELLYLGAKNTSAISSEALEQVKKDFNATGYFIVGLIGRINEFKGQYLLIEAMSELIQKGLNIKAFIVGHAMNEAYLAELKQRVKVKNLEENIQFVGFTKEVHTFMQMCDTILMTSKNETFGLVTIEAMKNGIAVIASNRGGTLEIIDDHQTGLLFESENSHDLALKIELLYNNDELRKELAKNGQQKAYEMFDLIKQFNELKIVLNSL